MDFGLPSASTPVLLFIRHIWPNFYGCGREEYAHILNTFPLVFPPSPEGRARLTAVLAAYDNMLSGT